MPRVRRPGQGLSPRPGRAGDTSRVGSVEGAEGFTAEEKVLLSLFRRYRKKGEKDASKNEETNHVAQEKSSPVSGKWNGNDSALALGGGVEAVEASRVVTGLGAVNAASTSTSVHTEEKQPPPDTVISRLKQALEAKKRKESLGTRGAAASGTKKKARINRDALAPGVSLNLPTKLDRNKFPASGLLVSEEWRSYEEMPGDEETIFEPSAPLVRDLANFGFNEGKFETLVMQITVPPHSSSWGINICPANHHDFTDVHFHFNPRRRFVAMNHREDNSWGQQEKYQMARFPDLFDVTIVLAIQIHEKGFHVAVDSSYTASFTSRTPLVTEGGDKLVLQVLTEDDYGTNLGLIVHEVWWGHKSPLPGLPSSSSADRKSPPGPKGTGLARKGHGGDNSGMMRREVDEGEYTSLHIKNLPAVVSSQEEELLRNALTVQFRDYGVASIRLFGEQSYGFMNFEEHAGAVRALTEMGRTQVHGRNIKLSIARTDSSARNRRVTQ